jgi:hypothetical protein
VTKAQSGATTKWVFRLTTAPGSTASRPLSKRTAVWNDNAPIVVDKPAIDTARAGIAEIGESLRGVSR